MSAGRVALFTGTHAKKTENNKTFFLFVLSGWNHRDSCNVIDHGARVTC